MECIALIFLNTQKDSDSIRIMLNTLVEAYKGTILSPCPNTFIVVPILQSVILPEIDEWCRKYANSSCWLQYRENTSLFPDDNIAAVGVREYVNGVLMYSMDGCEMRKSNSEPEQIAVDENRLHICKPEQNGGTTVIDGTIDIDLRDNNDVYFRFFKYTARK